jgi:site-specific recombinase XerD
MRLVEDWLADCQIRQHSARTLELRRMLAERLLWFLEEQNAAQCSRAEMRRFFAYLSNGHNDGGRWGKSQARYAKPLRPETIATYYQHLRTFFNWLVGEEYLQVSPMDKIAPPVSRPDQIKPFSTQQIAALLNATAKTKYPRRDEAIVRFLLDTGVRVSELCGLKLQDVELIEGQAYVLGKGNKRRVVCFGRKTARALRAYLREEERTPDQHLFLSERGQNAGEPFLRGGILQLIERLGKKAGIQGVRCSPHTFRHTFAIEFLRNGGNLFTLKQILGHTSLQVTNRYVSLAQADIQSQHRQFSPGDRV